MPLYPYRCTQCGHKFEKIQSFSAEPLTECPKCHGRLERPLTAPGLQFKGAGWYVNDYAPKGGSSADSSTPSDTAKPAEKSEPKAACGANCACAEAPAATSSSSTAS